MSGKKANWGSNRQISVGPLTDREIARLEEMGRELREKMGFPEPSGPNPAVMTEQVGPFRFARPNPTRITEGAQNLSLYSNQPKIRRQRLTVVQASHRLRHPKLWAPWKLKWFRYYGPFVGIIIVITAIAVALATQHP